MKKADKDLIKEQITTFMEKHDLIVNKEIWESSVSLRKNVKKEKQYSGYLEDFLFTNKMSKIGGDTYVYMFVKDLLKKKETQHLAVDFLKSKLPDVKYYDYEKYVNEFMDVLSGYKEAYFDFVARPAFLNSNLKRVSQILEKLDSAEKREAIIELAVNTKSFQDLNNETLIYNAVQKLLFNKKKYDSYFPRIVSVNGADDLIESADEIRLIEVKLDIEKLNAFNLNKTYKTPDIANHLNRVFNKMINENAEVKAALSVERTELTENIGIMNVQFYGNQVNKKFITEFMKEFLHERLSVNDKLYNFDKEDMEELFKKVQRKVNHDNLQDMLDSKATPQKAHKI